MCLQTFIFCLISFFSRTINNKSGKEWKWGRTINNKSGKNGSGKEWKKESQIFFISKRFLFILSFKKVTWIFIFEGDLKSKNTLFYSYLPPHFSFPKKK